MTVDATLQQNRLMTSATTEDVLRRAPGASPVIAAAALLSVIAIAFPAMAQTSEPTRQSGPLTRDQLLDVPRDDALAFLRQFQVDASGPNCPAVAAAVDRWLEGGPVQRARPLGDGRGGYIHCGPVPSATGRLPEILDLVQARGPGFAIVACGDRDGRHHCVNLVNLEGTVYVIDAYRPNGIVFSNNPTGELGWAREFEYFEDYRPVRITQEQISRGQSCPGDRRSADKNVKAPVVMMCGGDEPGSCNLLADKGSKSAGCRRPCGDDKIDACLVGRWNYVSGGMSEWIAKQTAGIPGVFRNQEESAVEYRSDGTFTSGSSFDHQAKLAERSAVGQTSHAIAGRWSAAASTLTRCPDAQPQVGGQATFTDRGRTTKLPFPMPMMPALKFDPVSAIAYSCNAIAMETRFSSPHVSGGPITTRYERVIEKAPGPASETKR